MGGELTFGIDHPADPSESRPASYFANARADYVAQLPPQARVLEVGCGAGATGALALSSGAASYTGIEVNRAIAEIAARHLSEVVVDDVETARLPWDDGSFDALILSEVLEHLRDPWAALSRVRRLLAPGARVFASSPNVAHHRIIRMQLRGEWKLELSGPMDSTHLRWFTPRTYAQMFESCGYRVDAVGPLGALTTRQKLAMRITRLPHLFAAQIDLRAHLPQSDETPPHSTLR